jgi:hypothetical protein
MAWSTKRAFGVAGGILSLLGVVGTYLSLFQPEFRRFVGLDKPEPQNQVALRISGMVVDLVTNKGIGQASVTLGGRPEQCVTDDSGNFRIDLPSGTGQLLPLHVSKVGYQPLDKNVEPPVDNLYLQLRK